jgi:pSer/pThr/pTyr-binding forkhead associated (FHA) protein
MPEKLSIVSGPMEGHHFILDQKKEWLVGRGRRNPISVPLDPCLSTRHAKIRPLGHKLIVTDLNSSNGSFIDGKKLIPSKEYSFRNFLVLGSTLLKKGNQAGPDIDFMPCKLSELSIEEKEQSALLKKTLKYCAQTHKPYIDATALLYTFFLENPDLMQHICSDFMIDAESFKSRWEKDYFFDVPYSWLNDFIAISHNQQIGENVIVTPLARHILNEMSKITKEYKGDFIEVEFLKTFFLLPFNLIYPLLDWEKTKIRWMYTLEKMTRPKAPKPPLIDVIKTVRDQPVYIQPSVPEPTDLPEQILPDRFWLDLHRSIQMSQQHVILGHKGSGKTSVIHRIFLPGSPLYPQFRNRVLYDSKVFLILNDEKKLKRFVHSIIRDLGKKDLVGIDHIDHLLVNLQHIGIERGPLLQALKNATAKTIIALDMDNRTMVSGLLQSPDIHFLGNYLDEVRDRLYSKLLSDFESRIKCFLSNDARSFIKEVIIDPSPDNISAIKDYLDFAAKKAGNIDFPFHELATETLANGQLGKAFFIDVYSDWIGISKGKLQNQSTSSEEDSFRLFAVQLEELVQAFSKNALKIGLHYSDQTRSLEENRNLDSEEKLQQLKSQIVCLLTAYQHGFQRWFPTLWRGINPDELRKQSSNTRKLWQLFEEKAGLIDEAYAEDQFNEATSRVFQELYRNR